MAETKVEPMNVDPGTVVTLAYDITDAQGEIIESSDISGPISFVQGRSGLIPGLDKRLIGMSEGQEETFIFPPEEAFGRPEDGPKRTLRRADFPNTSKLEIGAEFEAGTPGGGAVKLRVADIADEQIVVQMIHPLAGQTISMSVKVLNVRVATPSERESGKVQTTPPPPPKKA